MKKISPSHYSREYFFSEINLDLEEFERFKKGSKPTIGFLQALSLIPKEFKGPFLDIGCGRGEMAITLGRLGKKARGIDYSPAAIKIAQEILKKERKKVRNLVKFQLADCTRLPFKDDLFQGALLMDLVEHLTPRQLKLTLKEASRVLRKGGILIIHTNNKYFERLTRLFLAASYRGLTVLFRPKQTLDESLLHPFEYLHINYVTPKELRSYLKEFGFKVEIKYLKPEKKEEIRKSLVYRKKWKQSLFYNLIWFLINSPCLPYIIPTFWIVARKMEPLRPYSRLRFIASALRCGPENISKNSQRRGGH